MTLIPSHFMSFKSLLVLFATCCLLSIKDKSINWKKIHFKHTLGLLNINTFMQVEMELDDVPLISWQA